MGFSEPAASQPAPEQVDTDIAETLAQLDEGTRVEQAIATAMRLFILGIVLYVLLRMAEIFYGVPVPF